MGRDYAQEPVNAVRRADRAVEDETWVKAFLKVAAVGSLATVHDGQPFINTNLFHFDEKQHCIYIHTARVGRTRANIETAQKVCFSIMEMGRLLPADEALEFSVEYAGVTVFGTARIIDDEAEATDALQALLDKYAPHLTPEVDYRPPMPEELKRTSVFRIDIDEWSGKKKEVEAFLGAYWYETGSTLAALRERIYWNGRLQAIQITPEGEAPLKQVDSVEAIAGKGLVGDRYFDENGTFSSNGRDGDAGREVTLIAQETIEAVNHEQGWNLSTADSRRNLVTVGVPLNELVGREFRIGEVVLQGVRLCEPCDHLAKISGKGRALISAMLHRGGLRADIVRGGVIRLGDQVQPITPPEGDVKANNR